MFNINNTINLILMNPENKPFVNHEEEISENKAENKEKKEYRNLSFLLASDLIKQIKSGEKLKLTDYQKCSEYAVIHNKVTNQFDTWNIVDDGFSYFLDELPDYYEKAGDPDMKIFFCGNRFDIPLWKLRPEAELKNKEALNWLTPDGIEFHCSENKDKNTRLRSGGTEIKYLDQKPLSFEEIQEKIEQVNKKCPEEELISDYWEFPERANRLKSGNEILP